MVSYISSQPYEKMIKTNIKTHVLGLVVQNLKIQNENQNFPIIMLFQIEHAFVLVINLIYVLEKFVHLS